MSVTNGTSLPVCSRFDVRCVPCLRPPWRPKADSTLSVSSLPSARVSSRISGNCPDDPSRLRDASGRYILRLLARDRDRCVARSRRSCRARLRQLKLECVFACRSCELVCGAGASPAQGARTGNRSGCPTIETRKFASRRAPAEREREGSDAKSIQRMSVLWAVLYRGTTAQA